MSVWEIILLSVALSMDACAVAMTNGMSNPKLSPGKALLIGGLFGFFQFLMPLIGYFITGIVADAFLSVFESISAWVSFGLLAFLGIKMVVEGQEIFSKFYDVDVRTLSVCMTPGDINLENNCSYEIICVTTMDSGLTKEQRVEFTTSLIDTEYYPTAEIIFNEENLSVNIRPYCTYRPYILYTCKF